MSLLCYLCIIVDFFDISLVLVIISVIGFRLNSRKLAVRKPSPATSKAVSTIRKYNKVSDQDVFDLQKKQLKKRSEAKMQWGYNTFMEWRSHRLNDGDYDMKVFNCNLDDVKNITVENFVHAMSRFIPEVKKARGEGDYPGKTLNQLVISIQKYLNQNKVNRKVLIGDEFEGLRNVLDNVMKQVSQWVGYIKETS